MMKRWIHGVLAGAMACFAQAAGTFEQANADFEAGRFKEAVEGYEKILDQDGPRVAVLQNLGSAYFRMGDDGRAILAFERALLLEPRDPDLRANLKLAQDQAAVFPVAGETGWTRYAALMSRRDWSWAALTAALLLPVAAGLRLSRKGGMRWGARLVAAAGLVVLAAALGALELRKGEGDRGIVTGNPATVRISPFEKADERGSLAGGREVKLGRTENGYIWVAAEGEAGEGWVTQNDVARLIPDLAREDGSR